MMESFAVPVWYIHALKLVLESVLAFDIILIARYCARGKVLLRYRTSALQELNRSRSGILTFVFAMMLLIVLFEWGRTDWVALFLDAIILGLVFAYFLVPRYVVLTQEGVAANGSFHPWERFAKYRVNRILGTVTLTRARPLPFQEPVTFPAPREGRVEDVLKAHLLEDAGDDKGRHGKRGRSGRPSRPAD